MTFAKSSLKEIYRAYHIHGAIRPHRGVFLITDTTTNPSPKTWVLKQLKVGAGRAYLIGKLLSQKALRQITPGFLQPEGGGGYLWNNGNRYHLTSYLKGTEADYYRTEDLQAGIRTMAIFHKLTRQLITGRRSSWSLLQYHLFREWEKRIAELEICRIRAQAERTPTELSKKYLQVWPELYSQAIQAYTELQKSNYAGNSSPVICYHDWAHHNLILKEGTAFLIDFDYMIIDHPAHDRANLTGHYLRLHQWSQKSLVTLLKNFDRSYPFHSGELKILRLLLLFPSDFWILGRQFFIEKQPWSLKYYQDQWNRKIGIYKQRNQLLAYMESFT